MKVYVINLDKDVARLASVTLQLKRCGVHFERFPAVYAKELSSRILKCSYSHIRWMLANGRGILIGEIGCALSHGGIYKKIIDEDVPYACIFEDDVLITGNVSERLIEVEHFITPNLPQIVLLTDHTHKPCRHVGVVKSKSDMFAEAYVITNAAARALLQANTPISAPYDHWGRWVRMGVIELYHAYPTVANQDWGAYDSNIGTIGVKPQRKPLYERILRHIGFAIDSLLISIEKVWKVHYSKMKHLSDGYGYVIVGSIEDYSHNANAYQKACLAIDEMGGNILSSEENFKVLPDCYRKSCLCIGKATSNKICVLLSLIRAIVLTRGSIDIYGFAAHNEESLIAVLLAFWLTRAKIWLFCWDPPGIRVWNKSSWLGRLRQKLLDMLLVLAARASQGVIMNLHNGFVDRAPYTPVRSKFHCFLNGTNVAQNLLEAKGVNSVPYRVAVNGAFTIEKGAMDVVNIFSKLYEKDSRCSLVWVGKGGDTTVVKRALLSLGVPENKVEIFEGVAHSVAMRALKSCSVALNAYRDVPSLRWNYVLKIPEFLSLGLPVVTTKTLGTEQYINDGSNGFLFEPGDIDNALEKTYLLLNDCKLYAQMSHFASKSAERFDWHVINKKIACVIRKESCDT